MQHTYLLSNYIIEFERRKKGQIMVMRGHMVQNRKKVVAYDIFMLSFDNPCAYVSKMKF